MGSHGDRFRGSPATAMGMGSHGDTAMGTGPLAHQPRAQPWGQVPRLISHTAMGITKDSYVALRP